MLEFEISCDVGGNEDIGQLSTGHEELWDEVNVPVVDASVLLPWFLPFVIVSVLLEELIGVSEYPQIRRSLLTASMLIDAASLVLVSLAHTHRPSV